MTLESFSSGIPTSDVNFFFVSVTFCSMGFVALYIAGQLGVFNNRGRGHAWRLCLAIAPLVLAAVGAISRTMDYHHHWQGGSIHFSDLGVLYFDVSNLLI